MSREKSPKSLIASWRDKKLVRLKLLKERGVLEALIVFFCNLIGFFWNLILQVFKSKYDIYFRDKNIYLCHVI